MVVGQGGGGGLVLEKLTLSKKIEEPFILNTKIY